MQAQPELKLILHACFPGLFEYPQGDISWDLFLHYVVTHKVLLLVCRNKHRLLCPDDVISKLEQYKLQYRHHQIKQHAMLANIFHLLSKHNIKIILFKGFAASALLYGDCDLKVSSDIDILISEQDRHRVAQILEEAGFSRKLAFKHQYLYHKEGIYRKDVSFIKSGIFLELHHHLYTNPSWSMQTFEELQSHCCEINISGMLVKTLNPEIFLEYSLLHAQDAAWAKLTWFVDCLQLLQTIKPSALCNARVKNAHQSCKSMLLFFKENIVPHDRLTKNSLKIFMAETKFKTEILFQFRRLMLSSMTDRLDYIWRILLTSPCDWMVFPLPKYLFFLYYILRPFLWLFRKFYFTRFKCV